MFWTRKKSTVIGLDIGSNNVKAVELESSEKGPVINSQKNLTLRAEGILNEDDLCQTVKDWLADYGWQDSDVCAGLAQYLVTVQVRDFPPVASSEMDEMIGYETSHLSGISEEDFKNDYAPMTPGFGRVNPVLIGISRESAVNEKVENIEKIGVTLVDLTLNSTAAFNCLMQLHPEAAESSSPQVILDIGSDTSTVVIFAGRQILFANTMMIGFERFAKELGSKEIDIKAHELGTETRSMAVSRDFSSEIFSFIEQWRSQENEELNEKDFSGVWLCGGGGCIPGVAEHLEKIFNCPARVFGPSANTGDQPAPEMVVAYGLALQAMEEESINISLCPHDIRWANTRRKNLNNMALATVFLLLSLLVYFLHMYMDLKTSDRKNRKQISRLSKCDDIIPELENTINRLRHREKMMIPFVARGNNIHRFIGAIREIAKTSDKDVFFVYLGDETSFNEGKRVGDGGNKGNEKPGLSSAFFKTGNLSDRKSSGAGPVPVENMQERKALVLIGATLCGTKDQHYRHVRDIEEKLNQSAIFNSSDNRVDLITDHERNLRKDITDSWTNPIINNGALRHALRQERFRYFAMRIPFADRNLRIEGRKEE